MFCKQTLVLAAALLGLGGASSVHADPPKTIIAVFSEDDPQFAETFTLYADGKYQQAETENKTSLYNPDSVHGCGLPPLAMPDLLHNLKRTGTWRVLDKEGGQPVAIKTLASLPKDAVIEVKGAMPFGITWERQQPFFLHGDRTLPASDFQPPPPVSSFQVPPPPAKK